MREWRRHRIEAASITGVPECTQQPSVSLRLNTRVLVCSVEQSPCDDVRLDLRGAFKNIENAGVAQQAR
jgi:hypothetical protein